MNENRRLYWQYLTKYYFCMKVTVKGQITIPLALRERFGLHPGKEVEFFARQELPKHGQETHMAFSTTKLQILKISFYF